jgi:ribosomal protein RSM22 (predicted rRNA methylase)
MCQIAAHHIIPMSNSTDRPSTRSEIDPSRLPKTFIEYGERESMAYLASQLPFSYAAVEKILAEVKMRISGFAPKSLLDFGVGPGTAAWAASETWKGSLTSLLGVDVSEPMLKLAETMLKGSVWKSSTF